MKRHFADTNASSFFRAKRQKQEEYVENMLDKTKSKINNDLLKTTDPQIFNKNLKRLIFQWTGENCSMSDCEGTRLVNKFIRHHINNPLTISIITDDEKKFSEVFNLNTEEPLPVSLPELVGFACISGAEIIVSKLLSNNDVISKCSTELIAYAISSGNRELTLKVSDFFLDRGMKKPELIYLYSCGNGLLANEINDLFAKTTSVQQST
jgi:hypothetical protein